MSTSGYQDQLGQVMARLAEHRQQIADMQRQMTAVTARVTSRNRMLTVEVGAQADIRELKFLTEDYRTMAPAELSRLITETVAQATAEVRQRIWQGFGPMLDAGDRMRASMIGGSDLDSVMSEVRRAWPTPGGPPPATGRPPEDEGA